MRLSLRGKKILKKNMRLPLEQKKMQPPRHLAQLSIWSGELVILDIDIQLNALKIKKWFQSFLNPTNALWKDSERFVVLIELNFEFFSMTSPLQSNRDKNLQKSNNENFFIQFLNGWLHFVINKFPIPTSIEIFLEQSTFLNLHTKVDFISDNMYFFCIPPSNTSDKFTINRDLFTFLQLGLVSCKTIDEKPSFHTTNHKRIFKLIMDLIPSDWKHLLRTEIFQKSLLKTFYSLLQQ